MIKQRLLPKELVSWLVALFFYVFLPLFQLFLLFVSLFGVLHLEFDVLGRTPHATPTTLSFLPWPMAERSFGRSSFRSN